MEKNDNIGKFVSRHLSQLKLLSRVLENELDHAKGGREVTIDRTLLENMLDSIEIFTEDCETATGTARTERRAAADQKPQVARLN